MRQVALLLVTFACLSCRIDAGAGPTRCTDGICPPGFTCQAEVCVAVAADGAVADAPRSPDGSTIGADASPADPDGGGVIVACGGPDAFADDFEDGVRDEMWSWSFEDAAATLTESAGHMVVTLDPNVAGSNYSGYATGNWVDLTGGRAFVEVPQTIDLSSQAEAFMMLIRDGQNRLYVYQSGDMIHFGKRVGGADTTIYEELYDPLEHRWWSIREEDGTVYWETSTNGVDWLPQGDDPTPPFADAVRFELTAGMWQSEPNPGAVHYDNFNGGVATSRWCKSASRSDDFEDGQAGILWSHAFAGACVRNETGGQATFTPAMSGGNYCGYKSGTLFEATDSSISIEVAQTTSEDPSAITYFKLENFADDFLEIVKAGPRIIFHARVDGSEIPYDDVDYDPVTDRWWRIRSQGPTVYWDTSPDGMNWTERGSGARPIDLDRVSVVFGAGNVSGTAASPGVAAFDNYNRLP